MVAVASHPRNKNCTLYEQLAAPRSPLKVDRAKGIVYGVKIGGRFSNNTHGVNGVVGTEYTRRCYESAIPLYEGARVRCNHPDRKDPDAERSVHESLGMLWNVHVEDRQDDYGLFGDLHMPPSDPMAQKVMDDAEQGIGMFGLSHNAVWESAEKRGNRFVIDRLEKVRGVDLVDKPATNKNLWESQETKKVKHTMKSILEARQAKMSAPRIAWSRRLLEMDGMANVETPDMPADADPDEQMKQAFRSAASKILDGLFDGSIDEADGFKKLKELKKTHGKLTQTEEPKEPSATEGEDGDKGKDDKKKEDDKTAKESLASLTAEVNQLKREKAARTLCESEQFHGATERQIKTLSLLESDIERKALIGDFKLAAATAERQGTPRSGLPNSLLESQRNSSGNNNGNGVPDTAAGQLTFLRRGH